MKPVAGLGLVLLTAAALLAVQQLRQGAVAAARAQVRLFGTRGSHLPTHGAAGNVSQERVAALEHELPRLQAALRQADAELRTLHGQRSRERQACHASAAVLAPAAVRGAVRDALRELAERGTPPTEADASERLTSDYAELVRVELAEGLALEDSGWCRCPPLPDLPRLCRAIASVSWRRSAAWPGSHLLTAKALRCKADIPAPPEEAPRAPPPPESHHTVH